jgi:hypothetical protein
MNIVASLSARPDDASLAKLLIASLLFVFSLFPEYAMAWCDNPDTGESGAFFVSIYTVSACNPNARFPEGTEVIEFTAKAKNGETDSPSQTVRLRDECKRTRKGTGLTCSKQGKSPLAGTTYVTTKDMKDVCDETGKALVGRLTCVKGCEDGKAPKHIEGSPWEC